MTPDQIDTPALILDIERVERNIQRMAGFFAGVHASLRPHFKTPKCLEVVWMQLDAGAIGITCAKLGEAEVLANGGVGASVLIANQIVGAPKIARLIELAGRLPELIVAIDHSSQIEAISTALSGSGARLGALVEADIGCRRCGTGSPEATVELAREIEKSRIEYRGLMGYEGHAVLVPDDAKRKDLAERALGELLLHRSALVDAGLEPEIVSAGGTGTHDLTGRSPLVTEVQAGSYVFMDAAYRKVRTDFECALTVLTTIVHARGRLLITDCGMKALSHEFGMPEGAKLPLRCVGLSEEHGHALVDEGADLSLSVGDRIELLPSHGDTTINLHDEYLVLRDGRIEAVWKIVGRGRFR